VIPHADSRMPATPFRMRSPGRVLLLTFPSPWPELSWRRRAVQALQNNTVFKSSQGSDSISSSELHGVANEKHKRLYFFVHLRRSSSLQMTLLIVSSDITTTPQTADSYYHISQLFCTILP